MFSKFFGFIFEIYFCFIFAATLLLVSPVEDRDHHFKTVFISNALLFVSIIIVPIIIIYAAFQSNEIRNSEEYMETYDSLYADSRIYTFG